ncbi:MAG TPA: choice-of-anchor M domain-containing protein [Iamia sp.]|nr:choice-of-anchor M domain-containing protein [Iamia sp.]
MPHHPTRRLAGLLAALVVAVTATLALASPGVASAAERVVLDDGHVDALSPRLDDGSLVLEVKDDTGGSPVRRAPSEVLFHVVPGAEAAVPDDPRYTSLLGPAGTPIWLIPEVQQAGIVWAGWSTEELAAGALAGDQVSFVLREVDGPGDVVVFASSAFGDPLVRFNTRDGLPDTRVEAVGSHVHANWAFLAEGTYTLTFEVTGQMAGGAAVTTGLVDYTFTVGELPADPVTSLSISGMAGSYDAGDEVTLTAVQDPVTDLDHYHWFTRCAGATEWTIVPGVGGGTYAFTAAEDLDGCEYQVRLYGDGHAVVAESAPVTLSIAPAPVTSLSISGMAGSYDAGDEVRLTAVQDPVTDLDHYHWFTRCAGATDWTIVPGVGVGTYAFTAAEDLDGCEYQVRLYGDGHAVVAESAPVTLAVVAPTATEHLVRELYRVVLDRSPGAGEVAYWVGRLDAGANPRHLAESLARTREGYAQVVRWAYETALDRSPEPGGLTYWTDRLQASRRPDTLVTQLFASPEAWTKGGRSARGWVAYAYERLLDRAPDRAGHDFWTAELQAGGSSAGARGRVSGVFLRTMEVSRKEVGRAASDACGSASLPVAQRDALVGVYRTSALNPSVLRAAVVIAGCPGR